jgi:poly-gamma-glutamate synthesis protein (capsule biosynthesis protein)
MNSIKIAAVGDISLGDHYLCCGFGVRSRTVNRGPQIIFEHVRDILHAHDIVFGNLEGILSDVGYHAKSLKSSHMRGIPAAAKALKDAGFSVLSLANNHIMQHGLAGVIDTANTLRRNDIGFCGLKIDMNKYGEYVIEEKGQIICFLAFNSRPEKYCNGDYIYHDFNMNRIKKILKIVRKLYDLVVVSIHWGDEYIQIPSIEQQEIAHNLIDSGADIILGHHPHVLQGIEKYNKGLIFYSLGNFVFDMVWNEHAQKSMIAVINYDMESKNLNYDVIPIKINNEYQPTIIQGEESLNYKDEISRLSNSIIRPNGDMKTDEYDQYYKKELKRCAAIERRLSHEFWISNIWRYPKYFIPQYIYEIILRRALSIRNRLYLKGV